MPMAALASSVFQSPVQIRPSDSFSGFLSPPDFKLKCSRRRPLISGGGRPRRNFSLKSASSNYSDPSSASPSLEDEYKANSELLASLKVKLLSVVSGLNRGLAANEDDLQKADEAAKEIEAVGGPVDLSIDLDKLQGRWKLIYSSAFSSRTLGGSRPGPPTGRLLPITLGQVFQRIDIISKDFDNIVELELGAPWPLPPAEVTATLAHKFEIIGSAKIKITFEKTTVKATGNLSQLPPLEVPRIPDALRPPSNTEVVTLKSLTLTTILGSPEETEENSECLLSHNIITSMMHFLRSILKSKHLPPWSRNFTIHHCLVSLLVLISTLGYKLKT